MILGVSLKNNSHITLALLNYSKSPIQLLKINYTLELKVKLEQLSVEAIFR